MELEKFISSDLIKEIKESFDRITSDDKITIRREIKSIINNKLLGIQLKYENLNDEKRLIFREKVKSEYQRFSEIKQNFSRKFEDYIIYYGLNIYYPFYIRNQNGRVSKSDYARKYNLMNLSLGLTYFFESLYDKYLYDFQRLKERRLSYQLLIDNEYTKEDFILDFGSSEIKNYEFKRFRPIHIYEGLKILLYSRTFFSLNIISKEEFILIYTKAFLEEPNMSRVKIKNITGNKSNIIKAFYLFYNHILNDKPIKFGHHPKATYFCKLINETFMEISEQTAKNNFTLKSISKKLSNNYKINLK